MFSDWDSAVLQSAIPVKTAKVGQEARRPKAVGKFLFVNGEKFYAKGVTYGTFRPDENGAEFSCPEKVKRDFAAMADRGINAVRVYTVPPLWLLDLADRHGLLVMVGLPWEQHIAFLDDRTRAADIEKRVRLGVRACGAHPAVLCYVIGSEIPGSIVRWHGPAKIQRFLKRLYDAAKQEDPDGLVTYVNFPTTEYLEIPCVDLCCFNVYLESPGPLEIYLARLQNLAGERPLVMAELGLDSQRNGLEKQAETLSWQIQTCFASGCAGTFIYAWTDEWHRGGVDIDDWGFGLTDRNRNPKPALRAVERAYSRVPFPRDFKWPRVSVVVCSYNGSRTIRQTLTALERLDYPHYEIIVINDGSTDRTGATAAEFRVCLISVPNGGLSCARNIGMEKATGEIIAYIDDDAYPDAHWLQYLAYTFMTTDFVAVGGPNIPVPGSGWFAESVAHSPGGPIHILLSDREAEHIPGCNMAFQRRRLLEVGGFDPQFRTAGDDVDLCWRLAEKAQKIGFHPAAVVWHHRRNSLKAFWMQQTGYGRAEALLERKWPQKYNPLGHISWDGRIYSHGMLSAISRISSRIYHGSWGLAPFQRVYNSHPGTWTAIIQTPEWFVLSALLLVLSTLGLLWHPLLLLVPAGIGSVAAPLVCILANVKHLVNRKDTGWATDARFRACTAFLHIVQPMARLWGRICYGLTPLRVRGAAGWDRPGRQRLEVWSEAWLAPEEWLARLQVKLRDDKAIVYRGGEFDRWDLEVRGGLLASSRILLGIEEHGAGRQLLRFKFWPRISTLAAAALFVLMITSVFAVIDGAAIVAAACGALGLVLGWQMLGDCGAAMYRMRRAAVSIKIPPAMPMPPTEVTIAPSATPHSVGAPANTTANPFPSVSMSSEKHRSDRPALADS